MYSLLLQQLKKKKNHISLTFQKEQKLRNMGYRSSEGAKFAATHSTAVF